MLNADTKRKIDAARNVLVGKVPNPSSQIDQITNALIYKFMDDMDEKAKAQGGQASFFVKDLKNYSWSKLMDTALTSQERMNLYRDVFLKFTTSEHIPKLFRDILKDAYLPYNDPYTLNLFLKEIDYFSYDHSEELGNAFEYLLSILGSQGDAGQFRTPRHIIDFIVEIVAPTKDDKILDPACGTAGFLISAFNHILSDHDGIDNVTGKNSSKEQRLTFSEKQKIMEHLVGYDIDPTMAKLARVNLYLHGAKNPNIFEYDTLSSDKNWEEYFDVILANPPFMTPRGGIIPHKKFSISSNRSEVLFVDYIMNHLTKKGRAGIIVPEGIIFQSATAHKKLRENLVKDGLCAVVSLPSGVFNPYAGVKTSILLFDNEIAKNKSEILFLKIENDGFDLGAQRRPINKNDLPEALEIFKKWKVGEKVESKIALCVDRKKILESDDFNLSVDRYRDVKDYSNNKWPIVKIKEVVNLIREKSSKDIYPYIEIGDIDLSNKNYYFKDKKSVTGSIYAYKNNIIISKVRPTRGAISIIREDRISVSGGFSVLESKNTLSEKYLFSLLRNSDSFFEFLGSRCKGSTYPTCSDNDILGFEISLPPLEIQEQIVAELDGYQKIIDGAKQIVENWKPKIDIGGKIEIVSVKEKIIKALKKLNSRDKYLFDIKANERSVSAKLSSYLQEEFPLDDVDHEYNRDIEDTKVVDNDKKVLPDIIIHKRGANEQNIAVIELKINSSKKDKEIDTKKLKNIVDKFGYKNAYFINITENTTEKEWIETILEDKVVSDSKWEKVKLGTKVSFSQGVQIDLDDQLENYTKDYERFLRIENYTQNSTDFRYIPKKLGRNKFINKEDVVVVRYGASAGFVGCGLEGILANNLFLVTPESKELHKNYLYYYLNSDLAQTYLKQAMAGGAMPALSFGIVKELDIILPSLPTQKQIVENFVKEKELVESSKKLIEIYEEKIKEVIEKLWK
jgi:type I restriction enzyme M protein